MSLGVPTFSMDAAASWGVVSLPRGVNVPQKLAWSASVGPAPVAEEEDESDEPQAAVPTRRTTSSAAAAAPLLVSMGVPSSLVSVHSALPHRGASHLRAVAPTLACRRPGRQRHLEQSREHREVLLARHLGDAQ